MAKRNLRTFREVEEEYFRNHPEEIGPYIDEIFDEYAQDGNSTALLASLRVIAKVKGNQHDSRRNGAVPPGCTTRLIQQRQPRFDNVNAIMKALGYRLTPEPLDHHQQV